MSDFPCNDWPVDEGCCADWSGHTTEVQQRAVSLATQTLRMLTGYRVGGCPVTVRPCSWSCVAASGSWYSWGSGWHPYINSAGEWLNSCGCPSTCDHLAAAVIPLPGPIGYISEVLIDGEVFDADLYRVDNHNQLVRLDGGVWPNTQDMALPPTEVGTFAITYLRGIPVDASGSYAAGVLACEYAKACAGGKCRLPSGVTTVSRLGVTLELQPGLFPGGVTGIREVDVFIERWNPNHLKAPSMVMSPDAHALRRTTWPT